MKVLIMEKNLILLSRIKNSLSGHEVNSNVEYMVDAERILTQIIKN